MSAKLLQKLSANVNVSITRKITSNFPTYSKRDVIAIDAVNDVPDMTTHTEQKFEIGDKRRVRFISHLKYVNPNIAMDLIAKIPPIESNARIVWCDGGDAHLGHPKVYINLDKPGNHTCGYCGLRFYKDDSHHEH